MTHPHVQITKGFTIIELIVVIVLVGIMGVVIIPRFMSPRAFNEPAASNAIIATLRSAQQAAMGRADVTFEIDMVNGAWVFATKAAGTTLGSMQLSANNVLLETGSAIALGSDTCSAAFDTAIAAGTSDFELAFDSKGNLLEFDYDGNPGAPEEVDIAGFNGVRICVNDTNEVSVCVSPAGYAYAGNCDD